MVGGSARVVGTVVLVAVAAVGLSRMWAGGAEGEAGAGPTVEVRGVYGGVPTQILDRGRSLSDYGINARSPPAIAGPCIWSSVFWTLVRRRSSSGLTNPWRVERPIKGRPSEWAGA